MVPEPPRIRAQSAHPLMMKERELVAAFVKPRHGSARYGACLTAHRRVLLLIELPAAASAREGDGSGDLLNVRAAGNFLCTEAHDMG